MEQRLPPLAAVRVLDFSQGIMGPLASAMLGDMGADVIKIEPTWGESARRGIPLGMGDLTAEKANASFDSGFWMGCNRNKKSLAVNITLEQGRDIALKLAREVDVVLHTFRPGVMNRLGLGYDAVSRVNPEVIYCSVSGYGEQGPLRHRAGGDMWSQAMTGIVSLGGSQQGPPYMAPIVLVDVGGAALVAYGIMLALFARLRTGRGQELGVSSLDAAMYMQTPEISGFLLDGILRQKAGRGWVLGVPPYGPFTARDGDVLTIFGSGSQWPKLCKVLDIEHLANDPRFATDERRIENREELYRILDQAFSRRTRAEWGRLFKEAGMRCEPCLTHEELVLHPQVKTNQMVVEMEHPGRGKIKMVGIPVKLKTTPGQARRAPPVLGQDTEDILQQLGYAEKEINALVNQRVVTTANPRRRPD
ncbi:MAG: CoA transferase [Chloroflexi bacterium]|nr:CoA transferase [Chloroflexota bacterium]